MQVPGVGDVIGGKYRVDGRIATGGMGIVLRATHLHLREAVAIKILRPDTQARPESVARFMREARMTLRLRGSHAVRVFDVDLIGGQLPYIVMELLEGEDLALRIAKQGPMAPEVAVEWLLQLCDGVAEAHATGIVHRDLKPANVFVAKGDVIKVLDFGVSKATAALLGEGDVTLSSSEPAPAPAEATMADDVDLTSTKTTLGSPRYMSPEQVRCARDVDGRTDIWAIGAIAYEMLSGAPPFEHDDIETLRHAIVRETPKYLEAPERLRAVIARCMAKDPAERYADISQLREALRACRTRQHRLAPLAMGAALTIGVAVLVTVWPHGPRADTSPHAVAALPPPQPSATASEVLPVAAPVAPPVQLSPSTSHTTERKPPRAARSATTLDEHVFDNPD